MLEKILKSPLDCKEIQSVHSKGNQSWIFIGNWSWNSSTLATWWEELTHLKRPWCWERLKEGGEGDIRGWDGWMASPAQWTWVWVSSWSWWWTGSPWGCKELDRTEWLNWTNLSLVLWARVRHHRLLKLFQARRCFSWKYGICFSSHLSCHLVFTAAQTWHF